MAKRKRLTPAQPGFLGAAPETKSMSDPLSEPRASHGAPISSVAGDASARAALDELSDAIQIARDDGRLIERLDIAAIDTHHLVRDRLEQDEDEMAALIDSLRARGQQTPIEVTLLASPAGDMTHGLISGWRRLTALRRLYSEAQDPRFATVKARVILPDSAGAAYLAMVEENEIRVNLSLYERARIGLKAVSEGVFPTPRVALQSLYGATTRSKRSKIGTFMTLVEPLDDTLRFPTAIPEKLGLALAREIQADPGFAPALAARLSEAAPQSAADEARILNTALAGPVDPKKSAPRPTAAPATSADDRRSLQVAPGIQLIHSPSKNRLELSGEGVTADLAAALQDWLKRL